MARKSGMTVPVNVQKMPVARSLDIVMDCPQFPPLDLVDLKILQTSDVHADIMARVIPLCQKSDYDGAIKILLEYSKLYSRDPNVLNFLGALFIQTNQPVQADQYLNRAAPYAPKDLRIVNNRACVFILKNDPAQALKILEAGLKNGFPTTPEYYYNMALACHRLGDYGRSKSYLILADGRGPLKEALLLALSMDLESESIDKVILRLKEALRIYPTSVLVHYYHALYLYFSKDFDRAIYYSAQLVNLDPKWPYGRILFMTIIQNVNFPGYNDNIVRAITGCLSFPGGNIAYLTNMWRNQFEFLPFLKHEPSTDPKDLDSGAQYFIDAFLKCDDDTFDFLCRGLERLVPKSGQLEIVLTNVRKIFLNRALDQDAPLQPREECFLTALAHQSFLNEYVYFFDGSEKDMRAHIKDRAKGKGLRRFEALILMCYEPLPEILKTNALDPTDSDMFSSFVRDQMTDRVREDFFATTIPALTQVQDDVSKKVEQMYMENPYPRWASVNFGGDQNYLHLAPRRADRIQILVAGCGTGQHALYVALSYKNVQVTALNLSRRSLAYAKRKTEEMGITHIDYVQGDILELGSWDRRFDAIESAGVLHHLADPLKGLDILLGLLKPGGMIMLGLYSEIARASIVIARDEIATHDIPPTPEEIRAYRHVVLTKGDTHPAQGLRERGDFYNMSTCRDLIFHVQETRYTLPQISKILADRGLVFRGFNLDPTVMGRFEKENPGQNARFDLGLWHDYEQKNPKIFQNMYQFWAQKPL